MIGSLAAGKKAAEYGYKTYGVPGAVVAGAGSVAGVAVAKKGVEVAVEGNVEPADQQEGATIEVEEVSDDNGKNDEPAGSAGD